MSSARRVYKANRRPKATERCTNIRVISHSRHEGMGASRGRGCGGGVVGWWWGVVGWWWGGGGGGGGGGGAGNRASVRSERFTFGYAGSTQRLSTTMRPKCVAYAVTMHRE